MHSPAFFHFVNLFCVGSKFAALCRKLSDVQNGKHGPHQGRMLKGGTFFLLQRLPGRYHQLSEHVEVNDANNIPEFLHFQLQLRVTLALQEGILSFSPGVDSRLGRILRLNHEQELIILS